MSNNKHQLKTWAARIILTGGLLVIVGWTYMRATPTILHPQPQSVASVTQSEPSPQWSGRSPRAANHADRSRRAEPARTFRGGWRRRRYRVGRGLRLGGRRDRACPSHRIHDSGSERPRRCSSAAVGVLLEKDRLKLDEAIQTYVPQFPKKQWPVTLRQLMARGGRQHRWRERGATVPSTLRAARRRVEACCRR